MHPWVMLLAEDGYRRSMGEWANKGKKEVGTKNFERQNSKGVNG